MDRNNSMLLKESLLKIARLVKKLANLVEIPKAKDKYPEPCIECPSCNHRALLKAGGCSNCINCGYASCD